MHRSHSKEISNDTSASADSSLKTTTNSESTLRELSLSDFHFWRDSLSEQFSLTVLDQKSDGTKRPLPKNEIAAMALNEIAVQHKRGFFLHLLSRKAWTSKPPSEAICPPGRLSPQPGYTTIYLTLYIIISQLILEQSAIP